MSYVSAIANAILHLSDFEMFLQPSSPSSLTNTQDSEKEMRGGGSSPELPTQRG